ncbi:MAG: polysaccharide biosynthesis C-terminal domain-containing protein [Muribaculum sp.]|nr:polysaccharide biosynthesis C-terminal domain-containing protein [Muribaculum sp.]
MAGIKSLVKDTAVYGLSSILGRFLNWCLVPLYVYIFRDPASYGVVSYLYSFTAVALIILNYGMETGFFRFANKDKDPEKVYTTSLISVGFTSIVFIILLTLFLQPVSSAILLGDDGLYVWLLGVTVAVDAFSNLPFAYLRYRNKAFRFAGIKLLNVGLNIGLNLFFLLGCPVLQKNCPQLISWFYAPAGGENFGIGWIFVANFISTMVILLTLLPYLWGRPWRFDGRLLRGMLSYSWPLLILGVAGVLSQNMGQLLIPRLFSGHEEEARAMVGIYGANIKIAIVMVMFTQAFRYAYEPFIFAQARGNNESNRQSYSDAMKFFIIFGLLIFLGVMYFLPVLKYFVSARYWAGLRVVPIMMAAELCFGVFFNLSLWYKLTDRTRWGMYFSVFCFALMLVLNLWFVPYIGIPDGYIGSAWAALIAYFAVMVLSYFVGRHYYPIPYPLKRIGLYTAFAAVLYAAGVLLEWRDMMWLTYLVRILLLLVYTSVVCVSENVPVVTPLLRGLLKHRSHKQGV